MAEIVDEHIFRTRTYVFDDRLHAGELLAKKLEEYKGAEDAYVLAIPAGGVQVAFVVAKRLIIPLDLAVTRKLHVQWNRIDRSVLGLYLGTGRCFLTSLSSLLLD